MTRQFLDRVISVLSVSALCFCLFMTAGCHKTGEKKEITALKDKIESVISTESNASAFILSNTSGQVGSEESISSKETKSALTQKNSSRAVSSKKTDTATPSKAPDVKEETTVVQPENVPVAPPVQKPAEEKSVITGLTPIQKEDYYGRVALSKMTHASILLDTYDRLAAGVEKAEKTILLYDGQHLLSAEDFKVAFQYYRADYPQHFWFGSRYIISTNAEGTVVYAVEPEYSMTGSALIQTKTIWEKAVQKILNGISGSSGEYDREKEIHDRLVKMVTYENGKYAHSAYGALVEGKAVCEGYARAFQYLLYQAGLQCLFVTGSSENPSTGKPEGHAWNLVKINSNWYHVDTTWNDQEETIFYAYFNVTSKMIQEDHTLDTDNYVLPSCTSTADNYFKRTDAWIDSYTTRQIALALKNGNLKAGFYLAGAITAETFWDWFQKNAVEIARLSGVTGNFSYGYSLLGREMIVTITQKF